MKAIHKYPLDVESKSNRIVLKAGYRVVRTEYVVTEKSVYLWVEEPLAVSVPSLRAEFAVVRTGAPMPDHFEYLDSAVDTFGPEAYHVYQVSEESLAAEQDSGRTTATAEVSDRAA